MTIRIPDVSNHNTVTIEPGTVALSAKATEGATFTDAKYEHYKAAAKSVGAIFQAYHWLWSADDAEVQHCFNVVGPNVPLHLDSENTIVRNTVAMQLAFVKKYRALGGTIHGDYLPHWYWEGNLGSPDLRPLQDAGLYIISSNYTAYSDTGPGWYLPNGYGGVLPKQWQYTDHQAYGGSFVDFSAFKGTAAEYEALITGGDVATSLNDDDKSWFQAQLANVFTAALTGKDAGAFTNADHPVWILDPGLRDLVKRIDGNVQDLEAAVAADTAVDKKQLTKQDIADALATLPTGTGVTQEMLETALRNVLGSLS